MIGWENEALEGTEVLRPFGRKCKPLDGVPVLAPEQVKCFLLSVPGWSLDNNGIYKTYSFDDFHQTMAFLHAVAWVSHVESHHPELVVEYGKCSVRYWTHSLEGLSENDFICASKLDAMMGL